jgi:hypothetical protein
MEAELSTSSLVNSAPDFSYILNGLQISCRRIARRRPDGERTLMNAGAQTNDFL